MQMFVAGEWRSGAAEQEIANPYSGEVAGTAPVAGANDVENALAAAEGARAMRSLTAYESGEILNRAASLVADAGRGIDEAIALTNSSDYGLAAGILTSSVSSALRFARDAEAGNVMINSTPLWRADLMPCGGLKGSGIGKEGPRYAIGETTELKTVVFHNVER